VHLLAARREEIRRALAAAHAAAVADGLLPPGELPAYTLETPRDPAHGDFASNVAMVLARSCRRPPRAVAESLADRLPPDAVADLERVEVAGPGFLNFHLRPGWIARVVPEVLEKGPAYGRSDRGAGRRALVEFVSANPTGPLNVVNCRAAAFGDSLVRCLRAAGWVAEAEYYVNDAGGQFRKLALSLEARLRQRRGEPAEVPEGGYPGEYLIELAEAYARSYGYAVLDAPPEERLQTLGRYAVEHFVREHRRVLARFGVHYDRFVHESEIRAQGGPERVVAELTARGHTAWRDGALWLLTRQAGDNDDRVLQKSDGEFTYRVPDIAYHLDKFRRGYDLLVDIYGQDHHGEVPAVRLALQWLGCPVERLEVLFTQMIRLVRDGREVKISKRGGTFVGMEEFLDEVGVDAARFFFLMRTIDSHMDFDIELARRQSQENPVYYVQYAHARICSVLRQAEAQGAPAAAADPGLLGHPAELALCRTLAALPDEVLAAAEGRAPHRLTVYARELAERFHAFYDRCRILGESPEVTAARLALCRATRVVLQNTLELLGVSAPERM
jgi:arginyl-tRNA synthetase